MWVLVRPLVLTPAVLLWVLLAAYIYGVLTPTVLRLMHYNDFGKFYYSIEAWQAGDSLYRPTVATWIDFGDGRAAHFWNMNPPHLHLVLWPLRYLPVDLAFAVWSLLNVAAAIWAVWSAASATGVRPAWWVVALALVSEAALAWAATGQLAGLLMAAVTAIWLALRNEQRTRAGILLGVTCSVKPFLGVIILWLAVRREWRSIAMACLSGTAVVLLGTIIFGPAAYREWVGLLRDVRWIGAVMNASVPGIAGRTWAVHALVLDPMPLYLTVMLGLVVLAVGVWLAARTRDLDQAVLILLLTALLASPLGWMYYLWMLVGPALVVWRSPSPVIVLALSALLVPHVLLWPFPSALWAGTIGSLYGWSLLVLWVTATRAPTGMGPR